MKDYNEGFRHITVFGENEEKKEKLDNFLKENEYNTEESSDALMVLAKECVGTSEDLSSRLKVFMTRVSPEEMEKIEDEVYTNFCSHIESEVDYETMMLSDVITEIEYEKGLLNENDQEKRDLLEIKENAKKIQNMADEALKYMD